MREKKHRVSSRVLPMAALAWIIFATGAQAQQFGAQESFVEIHGYADLTYFDFQKEGDPVLPFTDGGGIPTFDNNHIALFFGANVSQNLKFVSEFHYEHSIEEPELPQANIQWRLAKPLTVTMGRFWLPFGSLGRDKIYTPTNELVSYPYTSSQFLPFHNADNGVRIGGSFEIVGFEVAVTNGFAGLDEEGGTVLRGLAQDNNQNKRMTGRVTLMPVKGLEVGGSYTSGAWDDDSDADITFWGLDAEMRMGALSLEAEYAAGKIENPAGAFATVNGAPSLLSDNFGALAVGDSDRSAYYLQAMYRVLSRKMNMEALDVIIRYDGFTRDRPLDAGDRARLTAGINVTPQPHFHLKAEYQKVSEPGDQPGAKNNGIMAQAVVDF